MISERINYELWVRFKSLYQRMISAPDAEKSTVFVAGNQRSGTNMLMDVLERSFQTDTFHERDSRAFDDYQMREICVIKNLHDECRAHRFVIKALCELQDLTQLMEQFSPAKTVWIFRHYHDVTNSMMRSFKGFSQDFERIAQDTNSAGWRGRGMSDTTHSIVKSLAKDGLSDESAAAMQWYYRNILFFEQGFDQDERVLLVAYENLVTQPEKEFPRIFSFLDLDYTPRVSGKVFSSSILRNNPPELAPNVVERCESLYTQLQAVTDKQSDL